MPSNRDFIMSILVGGVELPEYEKDGEIYVESNLFTPVSYTQQSEELVQDEIEKQNWPVTPYQIKVTAKPNTPYSYYKIYVDGQKATQIAVKPGGNCVSEGFYDGAHITEFLFSLPRFPQGKKDRLDKGKATKVGTIEVECWNSKVTGYKKPMINKLEYSQANKKDSTSVTNGEYMMATTKVGRSVRTTQKSVVEDWTLFNVRSKLGVKYVMGHSLIDMGFRLRPIRIPIHRIPASIMCAPPAAVKRKKSTPNTARKSTSIVKETKPLPLLDEVIEIDSDGSDDVVVGDFIPSKKQKTEDGGTEETTSDEQAASTSHEVDKAEESGDKGEDVSSKDTKENGDTGNKDEEMSEKTTTENVSAVEGKDTASSESSEDTGTASKSNEDKEGESNDDITDIQSKESADVEKTTTESKDIENSETEGTDETSQTKEVLDDSEIKEEVNEDVVEETVGLGEHEDGMKEGEKSGKDENTVETVIESSRGSAGEGDMNEGEVKIEMTHAEDQHRENTGSAEQTEENAQGDSLLIGDVETVDNDDNAVEENVESGGINQDAVMNAVTAGGNGDGALMDEIGSVGISQGSVVDAVESAGIGDGDIGALGDAAKEEDDDDCRIKEIVEAVLSAEMDCLSSDPVTVDPGGTFGDELILD